jgi:hypothetical protein
MVDRVCKVLSTNNILMKIYLLITGHKIKGYSSLKVLCKEIGIDHKQLKENLPFSSGRFKIVEIEVDDKAF